MTKNIPKYNLTTLMKRQRIVGHPAVIECFDYEKIKTSSRKKNLL